MKFWEWTERILKFATIIGGFAAAVAVWLQLDQLNSTQRQQQIDNEQSAIIYSIIANSKDPVSFEHISNIYVEEAQKVAVSIPKEKLRDGELRIALINLIAKNVISQNRRGYSLNYGDVFGREFQNRLAHELFVARHVLEGAKNGLSFEELQENMKAIGGDKDRKLLEDDFYTLLITLQKDGIAVVKNGYNIALSSGNAASLEPDLPQIIGVELSH